MFYHEIIVTLSSVSLVKAKIMTEKIWTRFARMSNGKELKFRIQEVSKDKFESVFGLIFDHYIPEEPVHKASKLTQRAESFEEFKQGMMVLAKALDYQVDACCVDDDSEELKIVGASIMVLEEKDESPIELEAITSMIQAQEIKKFFELIEIMVESCNVMKRYNLDKYYDDRGVVVHPDYRRLGIAGELFKARVVICKGRGVPMTGAWMTSLGSQKAATKLGWETICELDYKEFGKKTGVKFEGVPPSCKLMVVSG